MATPESGKKEIKKAATEKKPSKGRGLSAAELEQIDALAATKKAPDPAPEVSVSNKRMETGKPDEEIIFRSKPDLNAPPEAVIESAKVPDVVVSLVGKSIDPESKDPAKLLEWKDMYDGIKKEFPYDRNLIQYMLYTKGSTPRSQKEFDDNLTEIRALTKDEIALKVAEFKRQTTESKVPRNLKEKVQPNDAVEEPLAEPTQPFNDNSTKTDKELEEEVRLPKVGDIVAPLVQGDPGDNLNNKDQKRKEKDETTKKTKRVTKKEKTPTEDSHGQNLLEQNPELAAELKANGEKVEAAVTPEPASLTVENITTHTAAREAVIQNEAREKGIGEKGLGVIRNVAGWYKQQPLWKKIGVSAAIVGLTTAGALAGGTIGTTLLAMGMAGTAMNRFLAAAAGFTLGESLSRKLSSTPYPENEKAFNGHVYAGLVTAVLALAMPSIIRAGASEIATSLSGSWLINAYTGPSTSLSFAHDVTVPKGSNAWSEILKKLPADLTPKGHQNMTGNIVAYLNAHPELNPKIKDLSKIQPGTMINMPGEADMARWHTRALLFGTEPTSVDPGASIVTPTPVTGSTFNPLVVAAMGAGVATGYALSKAGRQNAESQPAVSQIAPTATQIESREAATPETPKSEELNPNIESTEAATLETPQSEALTAYIDKNFPQRGFMGRLFTRVNKADTWNSVSHMKISAFKTLQSSGGWIPLVKGSHELKRATLDKLEADMTTVMAATPTLTKDNTVQQIIEAGLESGVLKSRQS